MVLLVDAGNSVSEVARRLESGRARVRDWICRYRSDPSLKALDDRPRSGRPRSISALERHEVVAAAGGCLSNSSRPGS
ncbi:MAG: helix-turn-helix domain-containing protein [Planctomycetes bacterium]|nr:helix-turn-helix domain-containing protein [Planctomycetota bacterium]